MHTYGFSVFGWIEGYITVCELPNRPSIACAPVWSGMIDLRILDIGDPYKECGALLGAFSARRITEDYLDHPDKVIAIDVNCSDCKAGHDLSVCEQADVVIAEAL